MAVPGVGSRTVDSGHQPRERPRVGQRAGERGRGRCNGKATCPGSGPDLGCTARPPVMESAGPNPCRTARPRRSDPPARTRGPRTAAAPARRSRSRMNSTVGDDMLPYSAKTPRGPVAAGRQPSASSTASRIFGPPGWTAHDATSATRGRGRPASRQPRPQVPARSGSGTFFDSVISKPWSPTVQRMASAESGMRHEPVAASRQAPGAARAGPPTTAAPPRRRTGRWRPPCCGSQP